MTPAPYIGHVLTAPQMALLQRVQAGPLIFNGRARHQIEVLEAAGLVTASWDTAENVKGSGFTITWRITVTAVPGLCPGSGRPWISGTVSPVCPSCHRGPYSLRLNNGFSRRKGRWAGQVPAHITRPGDAVLHTRHAGLTNLAGKPSSHQNTEDGS